LGIGRERRRLGGRGEVGRDGKENGGLERGRMVGEETEGKEKVGRARFVKRPPVLSYVTAR